MAACLLLQAEEAVWAGDKAAEGRLKGLVTSKTQMIESKGVDPFRIDNYVRLVMTSNEDWVVPAGKDERRFCVLDVAPTVKRIDQEIGGTRAWFYEFPTIVQCRDAFQAALGQRVDWPDGDDDGTNPQFSDAGETGFVGYRA